MVSDGPLLHTGDHGTLRIDQVGYELPIVVRGNENGTLRLAFILDEATAARFQGTPERLASRHAGIHAANDAARINQSAAPTSVV